MQIHSENAWVYMSGWPLGYKAEKHDARGDGELIMYWRDDGKEDGNYSRVLGVYRDTGKENGNY